MNEHGIEDMIRQLYEMVQNARSVPFSGDKCAVEREQVLDMLDEISNLLPSEMQQSKTIVQSRGEIITSAKREAEKILKQAQLQAKQMVSHEAIYLEAQSQAAEIIHNAQDKVKELKRVTIEYVDDNLRRTEEEISAALAEVRDSRSKFRAIVDTKPQNKSVIIEDV